MKLFTIFAMLMALSFNVFATEKRMGTGGEGGAYFQMGSDIHEFCATELTEDTLVPMENTGGSAAGIMGLQNKKFSFAMVQLDDMKYNAKRNKDNFNDSRYKVIMPMHVEAIHLLIPKDFKPKGQSSGWGKFTSMFSGDKPANQHIDVNMLKGQTIGAWGGSITSAKALSSFFDLGAKVVDIPKGQEVAFPIIRTAGYPDALVEGYLDSGKYHLVEIDYGVVENRAPFYDKVTMNYSVGGDIKSIESIGIRAVLIGKVSRRESRNLSARELATCIYDALPDLADEDYTSPNWASVYDFIEDDGAVAWDSFKLLD